MVQCCQSFYPWMWFQMCLFWTSLKARFYLCIILNKYSMSAFPQNFVLCCHSKTDVLAGPFKYTGDGKNQRLNRHRLVLVTWAVKKWPPWFNLKPGWVLQQMCLHGDTAVEKEMRWCVWEGWGLHQGGYIHSSIPSALNKSLSHLPDLSFTVHRGVGKRRAAP